MHSLFVLKFLFLYLYNLLPSILFSIADLKVIHSFPVWHSAAGGKGVWGQSLSTRRFSRFFNKNKAFLGRNICFIRILWWEQAEDEVELFRLDHDKLHTLFQSFISASASLEKWNRQLSVNCLLIYSSTSLRYQCTIKL